MMNKSIEKLLEAHFEEDRACFARMDKRNDKTEELLQQMGEHLSHIRKDMNAISSIQQKHAIIQEKHAIESKRYRESVARDLMEIKKHTQPVIEEFENGQIIKAADLKRGENIKWWASLVSAITVIGAAGYMFITWLAKQIK